MMLQDSNSPQGAGPETPAHFTAGREKAALRESLLRARLGAVGIGAWFSPAQVTSR